MTHYNKDKGKIILVGAGPGDAGLLTLNAVAAIRAAEVVLYDNLVGRGVLSYIPASAEIVFVGKISGHHTIPQGEINAILKAKALEGKTVVRLKGGDPFLFGRGGEELEELDALGIDFEVIPGVTSAIAVPAYSGIPVTHRGFCSSLQIVTAHARHDPGVGIDFEAIAAGGGTMVFLMGVTALPRISEGLIKAGLPSDTPAAILERGTTARQRKVVSTLGRLQADAADAAIRPPAITIVGDVCKLSEVLSWRERQPLFGVSIAVTRPADRGSKLSGLLSAAGAEVVEVPAIVTVPVEESPRLDAAVAELRAGDWIAFTSPAGVKIFFDKLLSYGTDARRLQDLHFAVIGKATGAALKEKGILADAMPAQYSSEALGQELILRAAPGSTVLLPRAKIGTEDIVTKLRAAGFTCVDLPIYDTKKPPAFSGGLYDAITREGFDWIAFTSASTVDGFADILGAERMKASKALCIGEQTRLAAKRYDMETFAAENATLESMVERIIKEETGE